MRENNILKSLLKYICITISASFVFVIPALSVASGYTGGSVDLGTLTWSFKEDGIYMGTITDKQQGLSNLYIDKTTYTLGTSTDTLTDNQYIGNATTNNIYIKNTTVSDATALKTALNGITIYYQRTTDTSWYPPVIKIATTKYVEDKFAPSVTELNTAISTVKTVVDNTIIQADRIGKLHTGKQTRPSDTCPDGAQCLLITEADGSLHWYPICNADGTVGTQSSSSFDVSAFIAAVPTTGSWGDEYYCAVSDYSGYLDGYFEIDTLIGDEADIELDAMGWAIEKNNYGTIYGTSVCSSRTGTYGDIYNGEQTDAGHVIGGGGQCWCKIVSVKGINSQKVDTDNTSWVFYNSEPWGMAGQPSSCYANCPCYCANEVYEDAAFRAKILSGVN